MPDDTIDVLPDWVWELDVTNDPSDPAEVWSDITPHVRGAAWHRGRQVETGRDQAGTLSLDLDNAGGRFDFSSPAVLTNLISNPSVETTTTGYAAINSTILRNNSGPESVGSFGIDVTTTNVLDSGVNYGGVGVLAATPGVAYTFSLDVRLRDPGSKSMEVLIVWLNSGGTLIDFEELLVTLDHTNFERYSLSGTAPAGTAAARVAIQTKVAGGVFHFYADGWQFEVASGPVVNLVDNPSLETNTGGYVGTGSGSIARSNAAGVPHSGAWGLVVTTANLIYSGVRYGPLEPVTPGLPYTFSAHARLAVGGTKAMGLWISWYSAAGGSSLADDLQTFTLNSTTFARFSLTASAPALADHVDLYVITDAPGGIFAYHVDALQFEQASAPTAYLDGSLPGGFWDGTAHASPTHLAVATDYIDGDQPGGFWAGTAHASASYRGFPNLKPMRRVRGRATWSATTYPLWYGYLDDPVQSYPGFSDAITQVTATDAFKILAKKLVSLDLPRQRADVRIGALLDAADFPSAKRDLAVGVTTCDAVILDGTSALQHIQEVAESESGRFFISAAGDATFIDRHAAYLTVSQATFGEQEITYVDVAFGGGESLIYNEVKVTRAADGAITQEHSDAASAAEFMPRTLEYSGQHMDSDNEASDKSKFALALYKDYHPRIVRMDLQGVYQPDECWPQALGRELGDRLTVRKRPPNAQMIEQESFVEWIEQRVGVGTWDVAIGLTSVGIGYQLYPSGDTFFVLGTSALTTGNGVLVY